MYIISVSVKKEQSEIALFDKEYRLLCKKDGGASNTSRLCADLLSEQKIKPTDVAYIGVALEAEMGSPDAIAAEIERSVGIPCHGASWIDAKALGEAYIANDAPSLLILSIDDTVDSSIVIDKKIYLGTHGLGAKIAHMVIRVDGHACTCGRQGCLEAYVSHSGMRRIAADAGIPNAQALTPLALFEMSTPEAERAKKEYVSHLACGLTNIINLFQTHELVLEGPLSEVGDKLMSPLMDIVLREQYSRDMPNKCKVRFSSSTADTALIGAALLGR